MPGVRQVEVGEGIDFPHNRQARQARLPNPTRPTALEPLRPARTSRNFPARDPVRWIISHLNRNEVINSMPKRPNHPMVCNTITGLFRRDGVYYADGCLNPPGLGKNSIGVRDRMETSPAVRELDRCMAMSRQRVRPTPKECIWASPSNKVGGDTAFVQTSARIRRGWPSREFQCPESSACAMSFP